MFFFNLTFFELIHNTKRAFYACFGRELCSLNDFYFVSLKERKFIEKAKNMNPEERLAVILHQDKAIFDAWKENKNLASINTTLCVMLVTCFVIILR